MASSIKQSVGTPLDLVDTLAADARRRLAAVSVTTAEELLGLIAADGPGTQRLLDIDNLAALQADAGFVASSSSTPSLDSAPQEIYWTGASKPADVEPVHVSLDDVLAHAPANGLHRAGGEPGSGTRFLDCFGPLRNQGNRGTCVAHAVCALAECLEGRDAGVVDLSEQYLYWDAKEHDGRPQSEGTHISVAMARMCQDGTCPEDAWPYNPEPEAGNESEGPPPADAAAAAAQHRLADSDDLGRGDADAIRRALDEQRPVAVAVPVFANWKGNPMLKLSGFIPLPLPGSAFDGGHAMCAAGYDYDDQFTGGGYFILRNSWGAGFAPSSPVAPGHALLPFAYWEDYGWEAFAGTR